LCVDENIKGNERGKMKLAVTGKGGVGKTIFSGTLARLLARDGHSVIAIDADPDMNLAFTIGIEETPVPLSELDELIKERTGGRGGVYKLNPKVSDIIDNYGVMGPDGVILLTMGTIEYGGGGCACPQNSFLSAFLRYILHKGKFVILDMEAGIEHLGRGTARDVDLMIALVEPGLLSIETAKRIKKLSEHIGIENIAAVINKGYSEKVEERLNELNISVLGRIPYDVNLIKADLEGITPVDIGGDAVEAIGRIKDRILEISGE
jgi:CO dehydrogenase maturation factor